MRTHVKVLGVLQLISGGLSLLLAVAMMAGFGLLGAYVGSTGEPDAQVGATVLGLVGALGSVFVGAIGVLSVICGVGLLSFKSWARILGIIVCAVSLIRFPIGTIFGIYGLWVLFNKETEALFARGGADAAPAA